MARYSKLEHWFQILESSGWVNDLEISVGNFIHFDIEALSFPF